jgi:hypothetical protein
MLVAGNSDSKWKLYFEEVPRMKTRDRVSKFLFKLLLNNPGSFLYPSLLPLLLKS